MSFPLYESISKDVKNKDLTLKQKTELLRNIDNLDSNGNENMFALIRVFELENDRENFKTFKLPYSGKYINNEKDIQFDLDSFPVKLKQILYAFSILHNKKIEEDNSR